MPTKAETGETPKETQSSRETQSFQDVQSRKVQYLLGPRGQVGLFAGAAASQAAYDAQQVNDALARMPEVEIIRRIPAPRTPGSPANPPRSQDIIVAMTTLSHGIHLQSTAPPGIVIERDCPLAHQSAFGPGLPGILPGPLRVSHARVEVKFHVQDTAGAPVSNAQVWVGCHDGSEGQNATDASGDTVVRLPVGSLSHVPALFVKPITGCWEKFVPQPALSADKVNQITLRPLSEFKLAGFPDNPFLGWGQQLMGLGATGMSEWSGRGAKIAIIDSGCDNNHPALRHIRIGRDFLNLDRDGAPSEKGWSSDLVGNGTHCAGVIAGNGEGGQIRGFCPQAEVHVLKVFPGGCFSNLVAALNYCIENQIDVAHLGLGAAEPSELVVQALELARQAGVAVVVAAGNTGGPVQFPARVPGMMCVSAIGLQGRYPDDTHHALSAQPGTVLANGLFAANFSSYGPEVKVCGPGVSVISTVPGGGYASCDGTSIAAAAVAGCAGLVAAHHPDFTDKSLPRDAARVDQLLGIVMAAAEPVGLNPLYTGVGLPRVTSALTIRPGMVNLLAAVQEGLMAGFSSLQ